jgi:hypothetical protein
MTTATSAGNWCATWSRDHAESPAGTAVGADRFVLVELPLPWPAEIEAHDLLRAVEPVAGARLQAIKGAHACGYDHTVICYWRPAGEWFSSYARHELRVARPRLAAVVARLMRGEGLAAGAAPRVERDLLLCTHGTRDRCCAKLGGALYRDLADRLPAGARLWRTSHTGGHRFAPTGISFPEGLMWAGVDSRIALGVLERALPVDLAARHLRGCAGLGGGVQQAADAAAFAQRGWIWTFYERRATVVADDGKTATVELAFRNGSAGGVLRAAVERGRTLPIASCGEPIAAARKTTTELRVVDLQQVVEP